MSHAPMAEVAGDFIYFLTKQQDGSRWPVGTKLYAASPLIDAAPAMLEALEHIAASLYYNDYGDPALLNGFDESIIDAAIKAAKGEA